MGCDMGHLKNAVRWIVNILTVFLLLILALVIYGKCVLLFTDNKYPNYFGYTLFEVASGSMEPTLYINDVILVKINNENLKLDDIIAFYSEDAIITHRIVFMDGNMLTVKGDNNNTIDVPIEVGQVIGKVVKVFPKFGVWKKIITEPKILVAIFITLLLFDFALSYKPSKQVEGTIYDDKNDRDKDDNIKGKNVNLDVKVQKKKKDIIVSDELLEFTRKIDISEINELLDKKNIILTKKERKQINENFSQNVKGSKEKKKEKKNTEYTMRLDLNEIQKKISNKLK